MEESTTYQAIIRRGMARNARRMLLLQGEDRFGPAPPAVRQTIEALEDEGEFNRLALRLLHVSTWDELLSAQVD